MVKSSCFEWLVCCFSGKDCSIRTRREQAENTAMGSAKPHLELRRGSGCAARAAEERTGSPRCAGSQVEELKAQFDEAKAERSSRATLSWLEVQRHSCNSASAKSMRNLGQRGGGVCRVNMFFGTRSQPELLVETREIDAEPRERKRQSSMRAGVCESRSS